MSQPFTIVAIDGGAATGKSSTASAIAEKLGFLHIDTGAHYRTVTFALLQAGTSPEHPEAVEKCLHRLGLGTTLFNQQAFLSLDRYKPEDSEIRSPEVNASVAHFAAIPAVRKFLFDYQRDQEQVARNNDFPGLVMEGRDIGSVIFPDAPYRFYLQADAQTRALRRKKQGQTDAIQQRDAIDTSRKEAPLKCPDGAVVVDTAQHTLEEVIALLLERIRGSGSQPPGSA
jgi:cytidylate kinase